MKSYIERVIAEIPLFFSHFSQCLFRPRHFIQQQQAIAEQPDAVSKGVEFLILSFLIALFISQVLPEATNPVSLPADDAAFTQLTSRALFDLFLLFFAAAIAFGCLRMVGVASSFFSFFRLFAFFCGISMVLLVFANALTNIGMIDPVVAKSWIQLEQSAQALKPAMEQLMCHTDADGELIADPALGEQLQQQLTQAQTLYLQATERTLFLLGAGLQAVIQLILACWLFIAWFAYGKQQQLNSGKIVFSALLSLGLIYFASLLLSLMQTGSQMMAIYRSCPPT
ncbi:hypothetical protein HRH59_13535 [Rheinheimera sp. YQF-2]|uniref:Yip1 domain-containing protein n=1 Tax=Rheinheimera lutimaris TaxID=2740584 RepID=A0A7Y5AS62_9GAMM|nr:hypothetical protein [Rheinheimera lutimaris]NRQ43570.1 hypothetical protein [Rheinheimera lutimaris]